MARDITTTPPIFPPRLNSDLLLRDIQFDRRHVGPPLPWPQRRKIIARSAAMARMLPSCAQLPSIWNRDMDRFVCECDALGEFNVKLVIRLLKKKWPYELGSVSLFSPSSYGTAFWQILINGHLRSSSHLKPSKGEYTVWTKRSTITFAEACCPLSIDSSRRAFFFHLPILAGIPARRKDLWRSHCCIRHFTGVAGRQTSQLGKVPLPAEACGWWRMWRKKRI